MPVITYVRPPDGLIEEVRSLMADGQVNPKDLNHARSLVADPSALQRSNVAWLESLVARGGRPFRESTP